MDLGLQNKNIIVTGGTRGIGLAAAAACAAEGANISICGRTQDSLDAATAALADHDTRIHGAICDIADAEQIKTYIAAAEAALGGIDGLVNNPSGFGNTDDEDSWARSMDIDVMGVVRCTWAATEALKASKGAIVNVFDLRYWRIRRFRRLRRSQGSGYPDDSNPRQKYGRGSYSGELRGTGFHRVSRWRLGSGETAYACHV